MKNATRGYRVSGPKGNLPEEVEQMDEGTPEFNARASRYAKADAAEKAKEGKYSKKYPGGKEQHAKDTDAFMKRFPVPKNEEVEQVEELKKATLRSYAAKRGSQPDAGGKGAETALALTKAAGKPPFPGMKPAKVYAKEEIEQIAEGDTMHTHTAHLSDPVSNEWKGKMLIVADNDADAIKQAQSMAKAEGLKLMKVSKNVVVMSNKAIGEEVVAEEKMCKMHGKYESKSCTKCMTEEKQLSPKQKKIAAIAGDPTKIDADDFKKLRSMKEEKEPKQTSHTAANRYHAVESAVRNIMSQNRDLRTEAKEAEWNKNNPKKD